MEEETVYIDDSQFEINPEFFLSQCKKRSI